MKLLDAAIQKAELSAKELRGEFERTGNVDVLRQFKQQNSAIRGMKKLRSELEGFENDAKKAENAGGLIYGALDKWFVRAGKAAGTAIVDGLENGAQQAGKWASENPWLAAGVAAGIVLGTPLIGAALAGAVAGGGIATGILLASKDARVKTAWGAVASSAKDELTGAASVFVDPLVHGAQTFGATLDKIMPEVLDDFATLAPVADRLMSGAAGFIERLMPGIDALTRDGASVLTMIADELPKLADATSEMAQSIAAGGEGGTQALHDMLASLEGSLIVIGKVVEGFEKLYQIDRAIFTTLFSKTSNFGDTLKGWDQLIYGARSTTQVGPAVAATWDAVAASIGRVGSASAATSELASRVGLATQMAGFGARIAKVDFDTLSSVIGQTSTTTDVLAGQMTDRLMSSMMGVSSTTLGVQSGLLNLKDTINQNGLAIDHHTGLVATNTRAGIANREAVLASVESNLRMYDAQIASGVGAEDAAVKYQQNTQALHDQLRQAGLTEDQVHDLIGEYGNVPSKVNTSIAMQGLTDAINGLSDLIRQVNGMPTHKTINIDEVTRHIDAGGYVGDGSGRIRAQRWGGIWQHAATGYLRDAQVYGAVSTGARYAFAEPATGGEAFVPRLGDRARSMAILAQAAAWYGADVVPRVPAYVAGSAAGMAMPRGGGVTYVDNRTVTYQVYDATDPNKVVSAIMRYEQVNGTRWRDRRY